MTCNDTRLSEAVLKIVSTARKLDELMRDGKVRAVELALGTIHQESERGIYRCMDIIYDNNPAKAHDSALPR
jgi:hypothetical protein